MKAELAASAGAAPGRFCGSAHRAKTNIFFLLLFLPGFFLLFLIVSVTTVNAQDAKAKCPPVARIEDVAQTIHGTVVHDNFASRLDAAGFAHLIALEREDAALKEGFAAGHRCLLQCYSL